MTSVHYDLSKLIEVDFVKSKMKDPLVVLRFIQDPDLALCFCAKMDEENNFNGLNLLSIRKSKGEVNRLKSNIITTIFKPQLTATKKPNAWKLNIQPVNETITIIRTSTRFVALYPLKELQISTQIKHILIGATLIPLKMSFNLYLTHQTNPNEPANEYQREMKAGHQFTKDLYDTIN
jgi:hypothetical protein